MPVAEVSMYKVTEIFRLHFESKLSQRKIASVLDISFGVVNKYIKQAMLARLTWPLAEPINEQALRGLLKNASQKTEASPYVEPDYAVFHQELKRKGVTLQLLWEEHKAAHDGRVRSYPQMCRYYNAWALKLKPSMRQNHQAGDKLFIDYSGPTVDILDADIDEVRPAQIFVCVLGASNYTYVEATWDQSLANWTSSHIRAFEFFGGVPALLVPDNLKAAVKKACRYEPDINSTYADLASHYGTAIMPARPYKPKDKAKVENGVLIVQRWVVARLRKQTFFGLEELNAAIRPLLKELNERPFKKIEGSRKSLFEELDKPALKPLPAKPYEYAEFKKARVSFDYHVEVSGHFYSVPFQYIKKEIDIRLTAAVVECFLGGERIASHARCHYKQRKHYVTCEAHMPTAHQKQQEWSPGRFLNWGLAIGPNARRVVQYLLEKKAHPQQGFRACMGLLSLVKRYGNPRFEAACQRGLAIGSPTRRSILSILESGLDKENLETSSSPEPPGIVHDNIRGPEYYAF